MLLTEKHHIRLHEPRGHRLEIDELLRVGVVHSVGRVRRGLRREDRRAA
jgi:hypothetical protein